MGAVSPGFGTDKAQSTWLWPWGLGDRYPDPTGQRENTFSTRTRQSTAWWMLALRDRKEVVKVRVHLT